MESEPADFVNGLLNRIEEVVLDQTVIGRVLGYGRLTVAGTGRGVIELPAWLADPVGWKCKSTL